jgi:shikimate kinase
MALYLPVSDQNLILTGYIGPNQPMLGRQIAERLRLPFVNIEQQIADRVGLPIDEIRIYYGETRLKSIEAEIISEAMLRRSTVIRVSGRTLLNGDAYTRLRQTGPVLCLSIGLDAMLHRLHIALGARFHNPQERALALGELKREWAVRALEGIHEIDATYLEEEQVIETIINRWQELTLVRG